MFKRVLIANRGEIAVRVLRTLREMDIETVAVCSEADRDSLSAMFSTRSVCIGPAGAKESYLNGDVLLATAKALKCDAIHPGYGFLSENAEFAARCEKEGIVFIGPPSEVIAAMGDKQSARSLMKANHVPVVPGSDGLVNSPEEAAEAAERIGYPVLLKATAGGGGRGIRRADDAETLKSAFAAARAEAKSAFGNDGMYVEKLVLDPRHIEVQILADKHGNTVYLGERDCSIQKNHQKLLEEAPSPFLSEELRKKMGEAAVRAAKAAGYVNAGTVEFVVDKEGNFYFIEMNTRIQVEHPVTEALTGIDLVKEQVRIAAGLKLSQSQEEISFSGHAMECRIVARTPGEISFLHFPAGFGVRVESHLFNGCHIGTFYDPLLAKIIVTDKTRVEMIRRLRRALEELIIEGVETNADFMHLLTFHPAFITGKYDTSFWEKHHEELERTRDQLGS